jgi:ABC-type polysaccharide/polyol phosphate transport system ATPase subunit
MPTIEYSHRFLQESMNDIVIDVKGLSKQYRVNNGQVIYAIKDLTFQVKRGERWGIIGKNGSGKSTLLKILSNIIKPSSGKATLLGRVSHILSVGDNFIGEINGKENVENFFKLNGMNERQAIEATNWVEEFAEIGEYINMPVKTYSDGMYLRVAFAASLQLSADIILLDEVFSAGDAVFREKLKQHSANKMARTETILRISHSPEEIIANCSHCLWLESGTIKMIGAAKEVETAYYRHLSKDNWQRVYERSSTKNSDQTQFSFISFENEYLRINGFTISSPSPEGVISYETGIKFSIDFQKKQKNTVLHPCINIFDYMMNPILMLIANSNLEADRIIRMHEETIGQMHYSVYLPPNLLSFGNYYAEISFTKDAMPDNDFIEEAIKSPNKIHFEVKKGFTHDYAGAAANIFIKPQCEWTINIVN